MTLYRGTIGDLINPGDFPCELSVIGDGLGDLLGKIHYRDLVVECSSDNVIGSYSLTIVSKQIAIDVFGSGLKLVFFPAEDDTSKTSEFDFTFEYRWQILRYLPNFETLTFAGTAKAFFDIFLELVDITEAQFLKGIVDCFIDDPAPYQALVDKLKQWQAGSSPLAGLTLANRPAGQTEIEYIIQQIAAANADTFMAGFESIIEDLNSLDKSLDRLVVLFQEWLGTISTEDIKELLIPQVSASLDSIPIGIQFPATILREVNALGKPVPDPLHPGEDKPAQLSFEVASLRYSTVGGLEFDLADNLLINFPRAEILKSGLILDLHEVKVDFSRTKNIPEAIADGRPSDFVGVYVKDGTISFPAFWKSAAGSTGVIKARNLLIGTGGFSGDLALEAVTTGTTTTAPVVNFTFGEKFSVSLDTFRITLKQNAIKESEIKGTLVIPGFKDALGGPAQIKIKVAIRQDGDFDITAHEADGFKTFECGKIFNLTLKSVYFGKKDDDFYLGVSGTITFTHEALKSLEPVEVEKLTIWSDGRFEIEGGTIPLPKNLRFPIGPVVLSISALHMGSHKRTNPDGSFKDFRYIGFDGAVDINPGGVDARGKGIKFFYPADLINVETLSYLEIQSLAIDLVIPGTASKETANLLISGFLSIGGTKSDPAWEGGVSFALPKMKIAGGASMQLRPKVPAFIVDAFVELSTPIPLGATGLGIYGFRGLFGHRYIASKAKVGLPDTATWFDYYKVEDPKEGIWISKFEGPSETESYDNVFSIGAGVSLADTQNSGETFSCKLFLMLSLPELIYLEGRANILGPRIGLTEVEDPPFFAVLALSPQSVEMGFGVSYKLPRDGNQKGWILDLNAEMRAAFFFQNSSAWYINFGTKQNPMTARVLSIFDASAYIMLSASGIVAGAGVTFGFKKSYAGGLVRADVHVYIAVGGSISFQSPQIGGFAMLGGHVDISLMGFGFYLSIDTSLSVEVARPFYIQGSVHLCVGVTIGFWKFKKTFSKCFDVEFKWEKNPSVSTTPVLPFVDLSKPDAISPAMGTNMLSGESFNIVHLATLPLSGDAPIFDEAVLPLDTWVDIEFLKGLIPSSEVDARIGRLSGQVPANTTDLIPPTAMPHQVQHQYSIKRVEIRAWNGSAWVDYRPYEAMSPPGALSELTTNPTAYKDGFWQNYGSGFNKLRLLSETSLSYIQQPGWYIPEQFGVTSATLFCQDKLRKKLCLRWIEISPDTLYADGAWGQKDTLLFRVVGGPGRVINWNSPFAIPRSLSFPNEATAQVVFNQPCAEVDLKLTTFSSGVVLRFYKRETVGAGFVYTLVETRPLTQLQLLAAVHYDNPAVPVAKVEIDPINAEPAAVSAVQIQIAALNRQLHEANLDGPAKTALLTTIKTIEGELARLNDQGCRPKGFDKGTLGRERLVLQRKIKECNKQLATLLGAQQKACQEAADLRDQFGRCFPSAPSMFSYEVVAERFSDIFQFRFRVYDDLTNAVLFNSTLAYPDAATAERALFETLKLTPYLGDYALMHRNDGKYFFQLVDISGQFIAVSPKLFTSWAQLFVFVNEIVAKFRASQVAGEVTLPRRVDGKLPCEESLNHLACWNQLPFMGAVGKKKCKKITDGMLTARNTFCVAYNKLYRELYACNKRVLDDLTARCDELTAQLEIKRRECVALADQLAALIQLLGFINTTGPLLPPAGAPCSTLLHEVCCLSLEDYQFNIAIPAKDAIDQDYDDATDAIKKWLTPIWRPDTEYYVGLQVNDTVTYNSKIAGSEDNNFYFGFRTAGPVGHFHFDPSVEYVKPGKKPEQYMLTGLKGYIDYHRSYPKASGELIWSKPLFYEDARILLFFTKRYAYHFFGDWPEYKGLPALTGAMQILIKDPAQDASIPDPAPPEIVIPKPPQATVSWIKDEPREPRIAEDVRTLVNLRNPEIMNPSFDGGDCWQSGGEMIMPANVYTSVTPKFLKPLKLYTAVVNNLYQTEIKTVHEYVFQTSRYPNFPAQINSYRLDDGKGHKRDAVFPIEVPLSPADIALMFDVVKNDMSSAANATLAGTWADPFDRLVEGVMKLKPLDAAVSTEFNIVRNSTTNAVVAVWIRNPESFNDPKLPDNEMKRSIRVVDGTILDDSYQVLFSKDCAQAFVMHPSRVIPLTQMKFRFAYIEWNGDLYVERDVVISGLIPMNI